MKKYKPLRERRDAWFRSMFAKCFADAHEIREQKTLDLYHIVWFPPLHPPKLAKHADYKTLETRLKAVEQKVCDHTFCDRLKGCMESIFCSKCGALSPDWQRAPAKRYDDNGDVLDGYIEPEVYADGKGYIRTPEEG